VMLRTPFDLRKFLNFLLAQSAGALSVTIFNGAGMVENKDFSFLMVVSTV